MIRFVVDGDPVGKERARKGRGGHWYTPQKTRDAEARVREAFYRAAGIDGLTAFRAHPAISVTVHCFFRNGQHPDADNVQKLVVDALQRLAYPNDRNVASGNTVQMDNARPRLEVEVL